MLDVEVFAFELRFRALFSSAPYIFEEVIILVLIQVSSMFLSLSFYAQTVIFDSVYLGSHVYVSVLVNGYDLSFQVKATGAALGKPASLQFEVFNCRVDSLLLHWGALQPGKKYYHIFHYLVVSMMSRTHWLPVNRH